MRIIFILSLLLSIPAQAGSRTPRCREGQKHWFTGSPLRPWRCVKKLPAETRSLETLPQVKPDPEMLLDLAGSWEGFLSFGMHRYEILFNLGKGKDGVLVGLLSLKEYLVHTKNTLWARIEPRETAGPLKADVWLDAMPLLGLDAEVTWTFEPQDDPKAYDREYLLRYDNRPGIHHLKVKLEEGSLRYIYFHETPGKRPKAVSGTLKRTERLRL